jgi:hypothetical protein
MRLNINNKNFVTTVASNGINITLQLVDFEQSLAIVQVEFFNDDNLVRLERIELTGDDFTGLDINQTFLQNYVMTRFALSQSL